MFASRTTSPPSGNVPPSRKPPDKGALAQKRRAPGTLDLLKAEARKQGKGARPISSLLSQLEDFTVEMSPSLNGHSDLSFVAEEKESNVDRSESSSDMNDGLDFESDKILADIEKLLPGRGKGSRNRQTSPSRSSESSHASKTSVSSGSSPRGGSDHERPQLQAPPRMGPITAGTVRTRLIVPPRKAVSPSSSAGSLLSASSTPSVPPRTRNPSNDIGRNTSPSPALIIGDTCLNVILKMRIIDAFAKQPTINGSDRNEDTETGNDSFMPGGKRLSSFTVTTTSSMADVADGMIMQLMAREAMQDAARFRVLPAEKYEERKKDLKSLSNQISSLQSRLALETKIREAALSLARLDSKDRAQAQAAKEQLAQADKKVDAIAAELWGCLSRLIEVERMVFKHIGGVLRWGAANAKDGNELSPSRYMDGDTSSVVELQRKLASAETRIKEQERENLALKNTITRLEYEQEPIRKLAAEAKREARMTREFRQQVQLGGTPSTADYNKAQLDLATTRAELAATMEELTAARDNIAMLQLQLDENVTAMEAKNQTIADLLAENEEVTNQADMKAAAAALSTTPSSGDEKPARSSVWYRQQMSQQLATQSESMRSVLGAQLRDAVLERERLKLQLNEEQEISSDLRRQLEEMRQEGQQPSPITLLKSPRGGPKSDSDTETEDDDENKSVLSLRSINSNIMRQGNNTRSSSESLKLDAKVQQQESLIADLRRQLSKNVTAMAISEEDLAKCRQLYSQVTATMRKRDHQAFSVDALINGVEEILKERASLASELQDVQRHVENVAVREVELENARSGSTKELAELQILLRKTQAERDRIKEDHASVVRELALVRSTDSLNASRNLSQSVDKQQEELEVQRTQYENRIGLLEKEVTMKSERLEEVVAELEKLRRERNDLEEECSDIKEQLADLDRELMEQARSMEEKHRNEMELLRNSQREELDGLTDDLLMARRECSDLRTRWENMGKDMVVGEGQKEKSIEKEESLKASVSSSSDDVEALRAEHERALTELRQTYDAEIASLTTDTEQMRARLDVSETALVTSKQQFFQQRERLQEEIDSLQREKDAIETALRDEKARVESSLADLTQQKAQAESRLQQIEADLAKAEKRAQEAEAEASSMVAELESLRIQVDSKEEELTSLRLRMDEKEKQLQEALSIAGEIGEIQDMLENKESEISNARAEAERATSELAQYKESMAAKEKEFAEGSRLVETMQIMVMDLKKGKADMVEEMEDCRYREEIMRRKLSKLESEYEKLTRSNKELETEAAEHNELVSKQKAELDALKAQIQDLSIEKLGSSSDGAPSSAASMRADFRKLVADLRAEHSAQLTKEISARQTLESEMRRIKREKEMAGYRMVNKEVQTIIA
ncbi:uncharacterized protein SPPG_05029 [Spizellomyces punctatus DAOM BR117]|uniref:Up-regulated during septation protein 1 domain-containing protein n=1 Tax=Spizellomyces punctatus (strain DAOM BR117) TaxID=645134 RepID=A0A0L0HEY2_SPIPD|nr:hypothetical protein, variant [Spizellomyces punctatus DAOM BR117]XP_016607687.1 uncharacterized protein SPPG_05029 [Spizellomyces punctatus DAOM BR117]KNC99646.1 hypothetical protein, variant [Spizellomyces punctatus DAOM BR117]KNC99647.1 hypothetical protein SPPG_05029 [Spizellomyces punctatus DAOM BR117]|eukprot:XP_016607686.1 hypothetical protein, variant [Spizellomyces punctatus DAOM BR117]